MFVANAADELIEVGLAADVDAARRLVQHQQVRIA
jgi:ribosomal protein S4